MHDNIYTDQNRPENKVTAFHRIVWCGVQFYDKKTVKNRTTSLYIYLFLY